MAVKRLSDPSGFMDAKPAGWVLASRDREGGLVSAVRFERGLWLLKPTTSCGGYSQGSTKSDLCQLVRIGSWTEFC